MNKDELIKVIESIEDEKAINLLYEIAVHLLWVSCVISAILAIIISTAIAGTDRPSLYEMVCFYAHDCVSMRIDA